MLKRSGLLLLLVLLILLCAIQNVHAAPTLTIDPASQVIDPGTAASFTVSLTEGTTNATYALAVTGLPSDASYTFSSQTISGPTGSRGLTIQTSIGTHLYCPGTYQFTVTATNTILSSDSASVTGSVIVNEFGPGLTLSVSTNKPNYTAGETVLISMATNRAAEGTLIISPPTGPPSSTHYNSTNAATFTKTLTATPPFGTWSAAFIADDYCGSSNNAVAHFDVSPSQVSSTTTTATSTVTSTSITSTSITTKITNTTSSVFIITETGNVTVLSTLTSATTVEQAISYTTSLPQSSTTITTTLTNMENPPLEFGLALVFAISGLVIVISLVRRARPGRSLVCSKCGFKNPFTAPLFCVKCGQPLKRGQSP